MKGLEVEITEDENNKFEKQDQLLLLYAIHNPNKKTAINLEADLFTDFLIERSDNRYIDIDMCEIKPGLFCKFKQRSYTIEFAKIEVDKDFIDKLSQGKTDFGVDFSYVIGSGSWDLFFKVSNGSGTTNKLRKTFSLDFNDVDYQSKFDD